MRLSCYWQWISSLHCQSSLLIHSAIASWIHSYFDNVMTKFMINNRTDAWKTDVNLLNFSSDIHHLRAYQRQSSSWPVNSTGGALDRHRRGQCSNPYSGLNFSVLLSRYCLRSAMKTRKTCTFTISFVYALGATMFIIFRFGNFGHVAQIIMKEPNLILVTDD